MTSEAFEALLEARISAMRATLAAKAGEYASAGDRLHNFKAAAAILRCGPARALLGFAAKHLVSIVDLAHAREAGQPVSVAAIDEKIGDAINYLVLLEAVLKESAPAGQSGQWHPLTAGGTAGAGCPECGGTGRVDDDGVRGWRPCPRCNFSKVG